MTDAAVGALLLRHAREAVRRSLAYDAVLAQRRRELEAEGYLLVGGCGPGAEAGWEITDYRTGRVLASGSADDYEAAVMRLDAEVVAGGGRGIWHDDHVADTAAAEALLDLPPAPRGIPAALADAVADWAENGGEDAWRFLGLGGRPG
jgi:hypothetical protein